MAGKLTFAGFLLACVIAVTYGYSSGAPQSANICKSLTPKHPGAPQETPSPYNLSVDKTEVKPGQMVTLTISSETDTFKGFLVQGRKINHDEQTASVGKFVADNSGNSRGIKCDGNAGSSITHTGPEEKKSISVMWVAPEDKGTYVLLTTIVKDGVTYWIRQPSESINVV